MGKVFILGVLFGTGTLGCAGMQVIHPDRPNNKDARILEIKDGAIGFAKTYTCTLVAGNRKRVYAIGKTEDEARQEAMARCRDQTVVSFCDIAKISCEKN